MSCTCCNGIEGLGLVAEEVLDALALQHGCDTLWQRVVWLAKLGRPCGNLLHMANLAQQGSQVRVTQRTTIFHPKKNAIS